MRAANAWIGGGFLLALLLPLVSSTDTTEAGFLNDSSALTAVVIVEYALALFYFVAVGIVGGMVYYEYTQRRERKQIAEQQVGRAKVGLVKLDAAVGEKNRQKRELDAQHDVLYKDFVKQMQEKNELFKSLQVEHQHLCQTVDNRNRPAAPPAPIVPPPTGAKKSGSRKSVSVDPKTVNAASTLKRRAAQPDTTSVVHRADGSQQTSAVDPFESDETIAR
ncbi:hypothetical protein M3Y99_01524100 [Aphelenchoides fujianensis]|nr:hypothetical protein M3Y99_01524100 [Aphelenchoides fujianensis]